MAESAATPGATPDPDATPGAENTNATTTPPASDELGDGGKRAIDTLRRELREANKRAQQLEDAERQRQDAERSELDKAMSRAETAERRIAELEHESMQRQVAADAGIADAWQRLRGSTREELEEDARVFVERYGQQQPQIERPDFGAGARPQTPATGGSAGFSARLQREARGRR
jgi:hypothetical protein